MIKQGLYLAAPHGRLVFSGEKRIIATGRKLSLSGERVICSKENGVGLAFGVAVIGDPSIVDSDSFDDRFSEHRVSKPSRLKWWADKPHLYLYPVQYFTPFSEPKQIKISPGTIMDMGEIDFPFDISSKEEFSTKSEELVIPDSTDTIMSSKGEPMPWKPSDASGFTKNADTPEKQKQWAATANGALEKCKKEGGSTDECESSAVRIANAALSKKKEAEDLDARIQAAVEKAFSDIVPETKAGDDGEGETHTCTCPNCKTDAESDVPCSETQCAECGNENRGENKAIDEKPKDEKAGRRFSRSILEKLRGLSDTISELIGHGEYSDKQPEPSPIENIVAQITPTVKSFKSLGTDPQGQDWFMIWPTNAYKDREGEFFPTKAIQDYVDRHAGKDTKGIADVAHVPGSEFGTIRHQAVVADHFVCQLGTYDNTLIGQAFKRFFEKYPNDHPEIAPHGWGASHEFTYNSEDRESGVFQVFDIKKSTVLPLHRAANIFNPTPVMGGFKMEKETQELFDTVGKELGIEGLAEQVIAMGKNAKATLDGAGVPRKSLDTKKAEQVPEDEEDESQDEEKKPDSKKEVAPVDEIVEAVESRLGLSDLSNTIGDLIAANKSLAEQVTSLSTQVGEVKQAKEEDVAQIVGPRYAWEAFQASKAAETVTDSGGLKQGAVPSVVSSLAAMQTK